MSTVHRIPYTDFDKPEEPVSFILEVQADDQSAAYQIARDIGNPVHGELPPTCRKLGMRTEEIWPFLRDGHAIRRRAWTRVQVLRKGQSSQLVLCDRDLQHPHVRHEWVGNWGDMQTSTIGPDLLADDWEIVATPEKFPT